MVVDSDLSRVRDYLSHFEGTSLPFATTNFRQEWKATLASCRMYLTWYCFNHHRSKLYKLDDNDEELFGKFCEHAVAEMSPRDRREPSPDYFSELFEERSMNDEPATVISGKIVLQIAVLKWLFSIFILFKFLMDIRMLLFRNSRLSSY